MFDYGSVLTAAVAAAFYALVFFVKSNQSGEGFDFKKMGATVAVGAVVGIVLQLTGVPVSQQSVQVQLAAYAGITAIVESLIKIVWRKLNPKDEL